MAFKAFLITILGFLANDRCVIFIFELSVTSRIVNGTNEFFRKFKKKNYFRKMIKSSLRI